MGKLILGTLIALTLLVLATLAYAPYLPWLLAERYPRLVWPARDAD